MVPQYGPLKGDAFLYVPRISIYPIKQKGPYFGTLYEKLGTMSRAHETTLDTGPLAQASHLSVKKSRQGATFLRELP